MDSDEINTRLARVKEMHETIKQVKGHDYAALVGYAITIRSVGVMLSSEGYPQPIVESIVTTLGNLVVELAKYKGVDINGNGPDAKEFVRNLDAMLS